MRGIVALLLCLAGGCDAVCTPHETAEGQHYAACSFGDFSDFIRTDYGDVGCVAGPDGAADCDLTAAVFLDGVDHCIEREARDLSDIGYPSLR